MKWLTRIGIVIVALVAILALVPLFVSLEDYVPVLERELAARLGMPVSIDDLDGALLPYPHLKVEGIAVGKSVDLTAANLRDDAIRAAVIASPHDGHVGGLISTK